MLSAPDWTESLCRPSNRGIAQIASPLQRRVSNRTFSLLDDERRREDTLLSGSYGRKQDHKEGQQVARPGVGQRGTWIQDVRKFEFGDVHFVSKNRWWLSKHVQAS